MGYISLRSQRPLLFVLEPYLGILASAVPFRLPKPRCLPILLASFKARARARECIATGLRMMRPSLTNLRIVCRELALEISFTSFGSSQILRSPQPTTAAASRFWVVRLTLERLRSAKLEGRRNHESTRHYQWQHGAITLDVSCHLKCRLNGSRAVAEADSHSEAVVDGLMAWVVEGRLRWLKCSRWRLAKFVSAGTSWLGNAKDITWTCIQISKCFNSITSLISSIRDFYITRHYGEYQMVQRRKQVFCCNGVGS